MSPFTLEDLTAMVAEIAGAEAALGALPDPADAPFTSLGFDSMTVIELADGFRSATASPSRTRRCTTCAPSGAPSTT
ncbi:hypothetical protein SFUMM280S_09135 [Streptomyces fumanus]